MAMNVEEFKKKLLMYGADVRNWPEDIRSSGLRSLNSYSELRKLVEKEAHFEEILKTRKYEEPDHVLSERIITAALYSGKKTKRNFKVFFMDVLREFSLSRRAVAMISLSLIFTLILGFTIGYSNLSGYVSSEHYETHLEDSLNYEGDVL